MAKNEKTKLKKDNIAILILTIILIGLLITMGVMAKNIFKKDKVEVKEVKIVDKIEKYDYSLKENHTEYYKKLFKELKEVLEKDEVDEDKYADLVASMFVADFYDLNSKLSKNDVGGIQFVYSSYKDTFVKFATDRDGVYYYVESNLSGNRNQSLPSISEVTVTNKNKTTYKYKDINDTNAYKVTIGVTYKTNLGYPKVVNLVLIHNGDKLEVAEMN